MDSSFVTKQVAKEITLLRHLSAQQLYEISITWQGDSEDTYSSLHYLPEIFLYPYAVRKDRAATQSTKVSQISVCSDTSLQLEEDRVAHQLQHQITSLPNKICPKPRSQILHFKAESLKQDPNKQVPLPKEVLREERQTLNYDDFKRRLGIKDHLTRRNREVLRFKEARDSRKKRKI